MDLALFAVHAGILVALWLFIAAVLLALRADLAAPGGGRRPQPAATAVTPRPEPAQAPRGARTPRTLLVREGPLKGTSLTLGREPVVIGRSEGCTLVLADDYVSSRHARLVPTDSGWTVEDLGSTNGTFVDGRPLAEPVPARHGTTIRIGKTLLELRR